MSVDHALALLAKAIAASIWATEIQREALKAAEKRADETHAGPDAVTEVQRAEGVIPNFKMR